MARIRVQDDVEALKQIGELAWAATDEIKGLPANAQGSIAGAITQVLGEAYLADRARYLLPQEDEADVDLGGGGL